MIRKVVRLIKPGLFLPCFVADTFRQQDILVRPVWLSICAADQRYFRGNRPPEVLRKKLPMALFHEAVGEVLYDPEGRLAAGTSCVLLPGGSESLEDDSNYRQGAFFRSSNADGFCQELLGMQRDELLPIADSDVFPYVFTELLSVCCQAHRKLRRLFQARQAETCRVGVWGDGSMAYMMALALSRLEKDWQLIVFGKHDDKLVQFSFADKLVNIHSPHLHEEVDVAVECVGGEGALSAIRQAVDFLRPTGLLVLMGVSENPPAVPTRLLLEKGLVVTGVSRSTRQDFETAMELLAMEDVKNSLNRLCSAKVDMTDAATLVDIFHMDAAMPFKTVIHSML